MAAHTAINLRFSVPLLLSLALAACGGGDGGGAPAAPPALAADAASASIGVAGGTLTTAGGAQVVVPPGALTAATTIAIERSSAGAAALPAGATPAGVMYAFTPHGTSFAAPVTVSVPVDLSTFPAGLTPAFYKTNATGAWERIAGATLSGAILTAQVTGFSNVVAVVPPHITQPPRDVTVNAGSPADFGVTALGSPPFSYQWQTSTDAGLTWSDIAGATARNHTTPAAVDADNGSRYRVIVSNPDGASTSASATLTVTVPVIAPAIATQPAAVSIGLGASATFTVVATGTAPVYRWEISHNGGVSFSDAGNATPSLTHANALLSDNGVIYRVVVSNSAGSVTSASAVLTVTAPPPPPVGTWQALGGTLDFLPANQSIDPAVVLDPAGNPVVVWSEYGTASAGIHVKRWDGAGWVALGDDLGVYRDPSSRQHHAASIAIDPTSGHPVVSWSEYRGSGGNTDSSNVYVKRWNGSAWEPLGAALNVDPAQGAHGPKVRVTSAGVPVVAWWESPHFTFARAWNGSAWVPFGGQNAVSPTNASAVYRSGTALALDVTGNPLVLFHPITSALAAARGSGSGWAPLGAFVNGTLANPFSWSADVDSAGRPAVLMSTFQSGTPTTVVVRRFDNGAWADVGLPLFTATVSTRSDFAYGTTLAAPFGTASLIASWFVETSDTSIPVVHSFRQWNGAAWSPLARDLPHYCQLAVRTLAATPASATPVAACLRDTAGVRDIIVYRMVP